MPLACTYVPSPAHRYPGHPESPERFSRLAGIQAAVSDTHLWLEPQPANLADLARVHSSDLLDFLQDVERDAPLLIDMSPTYVARGSWQAALLAAGGVLGVTRAVLAGEAQAGVALVRPPGHHAERRQAKGFCLLNNIAIGVADALESGLPRALIVDFDAHHGNGTQDIFIDNKRVSYLSTHQQGIYPQSGALEEAPLARGRIINLPLPAYAGDRGLQQIAAEVMTPLAYQFQPQMIFVSAGFDAHWSDPLTLLGVSTHGYFELCQELMALAAQLCDGRIVFVLEGGYDPGYLAECVAVLFAAAENRSDDLESSTYSPYPEPDLEALINRARRLHGLD